MTYLLDTPVVLWLLLDPDRVPDDLLGRLRQRSSRLLVSAASAWEVATKHRLGRLPEASDVVTSWQRHLEHLGVDDLPVSTAHALRAGGLDSPHRDPFDRVLVAQAQLEDVALVTADAAVRRLEPARTVWA